ncbi:pyridoxamine 5'-phosphate oxidase family protein [Bradyrhizobium sp. AUGA SZCCT0222]|uniref:pyridoxamine 5'-phosphate oxidase family protein n=1 Tax=Bradyrhizobium sp. AUGA SZCCT0222 TaxID=2807668 RepID=UPI001BA5EAB2|nr:pyridoxamine 5'-phosphate oxidase family protein [Bradyrhizobium sp. AUGA SZCCT0222]MBR1269355.1 pyridoxamine 5'-phosphate oxidase family protein [Bradyrhizobium sp. AUGA SZCCT0222]
MSNQDYFPATERTRIKQFAFLGKYDRETIFGILDAALLGHVGFIVDNQPVVTPTAFWRVGESLYWHGSLESRMLKQVSSGLPVSFTVALVDGIKLSRVMSRHSFNYRSVMIFGRAEAVSDPQAKMEGMQAFVNRILPGRWEDGVQQPTFTEIERMTLVKMDIQEASAKTSSGVPPDSPLLYDRVNTWAGYIPIKLAVGKPVADPHLRSDIGVPKYAIDVAKRFKAQDLSEVELDVPHYPRRPVQTPPTPVGEFKISVLNTGQTILARANQTLLASALDNGIEFPFGCASGGCATCKTRLVTGDVEMLAYEKRALSDEERAGGWILACRAQPRADCEVAFVKLRPESKVLGTIVAQSKLTHDITRLLIRLEKRAEFKFKSGQFIMLKLPDLPEREYSLANQPDDELLELNVRAMTPGLVSRTISRENLLDTEVEIRGPFGIAHFREDEKRPIYAFAGGSGLAPVKSIVDRSLRLGSNGPITLCFGVRDERDLYYVDHFEKCAREHPNFSFFPVLSAATGTTSRLVGSVADIIAKMAPDLTQATIYIAGPPAMVDSCRRAAMMLGANETRVLADAFLTSADKAKLVVAV